MFGQYNFTLHEDEECGQYLWLPDGKEVTPDNKLGDSALTRFMKDLKSAAEAHVQKDGCFCTAVYSYGEEDPENNNHLFVNENYPMFDDLKKLIIKLPHSARRVRTVTVDAAPEMPETYKTGKLNEAELRAVIDAKFAVNECIDPLEEIYNAGNVCRVTCMCGEVLY